MIMAIDDENNVYNINDLCMLEDFDWAARELCVPQDPIECIPAFPDFYDGPISTNELNLLEDFDFFTKSDHQEEIITQTAPSKDCKSSNAAGGITTKKPRSKRTTKQSAWSTEDFLFSPIENHPDNMSSESDTSFASEKENFPSSVSEKENYIPERRCSHCQIDNTPQWRMGPLGPKTLCNACGVRYKTGRLLPEYRPAASPTFDDRKHSNFHKQILKKRANLI